MKSTDGPWLRPALLAGGAAIVLSAGVAAAGERMGDAELTAAFKGTTLDGEYFGGEPFRETYRPDGTIRYLEPNAAFDGKWSVKDGRFCTFYEGMAGGCFIVEQAGSNCFIFHVPNANSDRVDPSVWVAHGWERAKGENTCPTEPETAV